MLIATFNDMTGWAGKTITFEDEHFILEGHGPITAADIMKYDERGQIEWAGEGMRAWVGSRASACSRGPQQTTANAPGDEAGPTLVGSDNGGAILVATLGKTSTSASKKITFEGGLFYLEGRGHIAAHTVMEYDQEGQLNWATTGMRGWVLRERVPAEQAKLIAFDTSVPLTGTPLATFGPSSDLAGKRVVQQRYFIVLEDRGPISPQRVMEYDQQGVLVWTSEEKRAELKAAADEAAKAASGSDEQTAQQGTTAFQDGQFVLGGARPRSSAELQNMQSSVAEAAVNKLMPIKARKIYEANNGPRQYDFVIEGAGSQCLVALPESCIIVKPGIMAGASGGGRFTEFYYSDITGIEVNTGMVSAVLELTTPAYQGKSKDYWRMGPNTDPYKVSNCLPGVKLLFCEGPGAKQIEELRRRVRAAKSPRPAAPAEPRPTDFRPTPSIADEIAKLADLHSKGLISAEEFAAFKAKLTE